MKVHLLCTILLTNTPLYQDNFYGSNVSVSTSKLDQFLSLLHSYARLKTTSQDFFVSFDSSYAVYEPLVLQRILDLFPNAKVSIGRLDSYLGWKDSINNIEDDNDWILLASNHDHVYLHESHTPFHDFVKFLECNNLSIGHISHWQECVASRKIDFCQNGEISGFTYPTDFFIGTCLVRKNFLMKCFEQDFTNGELFVRPDNPFGPGIKFKHRLCGVPNLELFRHLDGYSYTGIKSTLAQPIRACCHATVTKEIIHKDWDKGFSVDLKRNRAEIPLSPIDDVLITDGVLLVTLLNASCYRARFSVMRGLLKFWSKSPAQQIRVLIKLLFHFSVWRSYFAPLFYPIRILLYPWPSPVSLYKSNNTKTT